MKRTTQKRAKLYYAPAGCRWAIWSQDVAPTILEGVSSRKEAANVTKKIARATGRKYSGYSLDPKQAQQARKDAAARDRLARQRQKSLSSSEPWDYVPDEDDDTSWYLQHI